MASCGFSDLTDEEMIEISAKTGENVEKVIEAVVEKVPPPAGNPDAPTRALIFSSQYDPHKGVVIFVRVVDGTLPFDTHSTIRFMASNASVAPIEIGFFLPQMVRSEGLQNRGSRVYCDGFERRPVCQSRRHNYTA